MESGCLAFPLLTNQSGRQTKHLYGEKAHYPEMKLIPHV